MNKLKVYLSGSVRNTEKDFQSWRNHCQMLQQNGFYENLNFVDPNEYFNYTNKLPKTDKQCLDLFMWQIDKCDVVLCNLDYSNISIGTSMEVEHSHCHNIPIIGFGSKTETWYNWTKERCSIVFEDLEEAIEYLNNSYGKVVC